MKCIVPILLLATLTSCASDIQRNFTASTPAGKTVRHFLGIPESDSVDFIRWKLALKDSGYSLDCQYGIGKPNTNGFINGGKTIQLTGVFRFKQDNYTLVNANRYLQLREINDALLQILDEDSKMLVGTGGWSYTLNSTSANALDELNIISPKSALKDSIAFEGRTPCPGLNNEPGSECYKLKWWIVFYADPATQQPSNYFMKNISPPRVNSGNGTWQIKEGKNKRLIYQLNPANGNKPIYLVKLDENILVFTDANGNLLVGNEDFSYTLNRRW